MMTCKGITLLFKKGCKIRDIKGKRCLLFTPIFFLDFRKVFSGIFFLFFNEFSDLDLIKSQDFHVKIRKIHNRNSGWHRHQVYTLLELGLSLPGLDSQGMDMTCMNDIRNRVNYKVIFFLRGYGNPASVRWSKVPALQHLKDCTCRLLIRDTR